MFEVSGNVTFKYSIDFLVKLCKEILYLKQFKEKWWELLAMMDNHEGNLEFCYAMNLGKDASIGVSKS